MITRRPGYCMVCSMEPNPLSVTTASMIAASPDYAKVKLAGVTTGGPGKVDLVPPYAIHAEQGGAVRRDQPQSFCEANAWPAASYRTATIRNPIKSVQRSVPNAGSI
jgi:hypothetical protein